MLRLCSSRGGHDGDAVLGSSSGSVQDGRTDRQRVRSVSTRLIQFFFSQVHENIQMMNQPFEIISSFFSLFLEKCVKEKKSVLWSTGGIMYVLN